MLRITIELLPFGLEQYKRHMGTLEISNTGTGTQETGNYHYTLSKFGQPETVWRKGEIFGFPRKKRGPFDLLYLVLQQAVGKRNSPKYADEVVDELPDEMQPAAQPGAEGETK